MQKDTLAERLRRRPAKPMGSARVGSNPTGVDLSKQTKEAEYRTPLNLLGSCTRTSFEFISERCGLCRLYFLTKKACALLADS